jgi:hypothetical protein
MLTRRQALGCSAASAIPVFAYAQPATGLQNLGMVAILSSHGKCLQGKSNGELHASQDFSKRGAEETWFLVGVDTPNHIYALYNFATGNFLSVLVNGCAGSTTTILGPGQQWTIESGKSYGILNAFMIINKSSGFLLGGNAQGDNTSCGGEVNCSTTKSQIAPGQFADSTWGGWWTMTSVGAPAPSNGIWNQVDGFFAGMANKVSPADVAALLAAI